MAEIVNVGEIFYKDGKEVTVVRLGKMVINNKECECVVYDYVDRKCGSTVAEKKSDFIASIIPTTLRNGDRIIATCMGKILDTYKIDGHGYEIANAIDGHGTMMSFLLKIKPNGLVEPAAVYNNIPQKTEFIFVSQRLEKKLAVSKFVNSCLSKIGNIQKTLSSDKLDYEHMDTIELQSLTLSIDKVKKEVDKTLKFLNNE